MTQASVGFHCPECVQAGAARSRSMSLRDLGPERPLATQVLIALNVVAFVAMAVTGGSFWGAGGTVYREGVIFGPFVAAGDWWRVVTGGFLHSGLLHLGMNMLILWILGQMLEPLLGRLRFVTLYFACLVAGSFGVLLVSPNSPTLGASGAVFGLMGAAIVAQRRDGIDVWRNGIGGLVLINLFITFLVPNISIGGHIGGLVGGVVVGAIVFALDRAVPQPWVGALVAVAFTVVLYAASLWAANQWMSPVLDL
jgi:membrane associated rhomboid family serine protease